MFEKQIKTAIKISLEFSKRIITGKELLISKRILTTIISEFDPVNLMLWRHQTSQIFV